MQMCPNAYSKRESPNDGKFGKLPEFCLGKAGSLIDFPNVSEFITFSQLSPLVCYYLFCFQHSG